MSSATPKPYNTGLKTHLFGYLPQLELKIHVLCRKWEVATFRGHVQGGSAGRIPKILFDPLFVMYHHIFSCEN